MRIGENIVEVSQDDGKTDWLKTFAIATLAKVETNGLAQAGQHSACRSRGRAESEHFVHKIVKLKPLIVAPVENKVSIIDERKHIHVDVLQRLDSLNVLENCLKFLLRDLAVVICVDAPDTLFQLLRCLCQLICLALRIRD